MRGLPKLARLSTSRAQEVRELRGERAVSQDPLSRVQCPRHGYDLVRLQIGGMEIVRLREGAEVIVGKAT